jgi:Uma2 family endonuclease
MSAPTVEDLSQQVILRKRMSFEEFLEYPTEGKAEWVDGELIEMSPPSLRHADVAGELFVLLRTTLTGAEVTWDVGIRTSPNLRVPDINVRDKDEIEVNVGVIRGMYLAVEVLSPSTQREDRTRTADEYLAAGVAQYWIVDHRKRTIEILLAENGAWRLLHTLDDAHPEADVTVGPYGTVHLTQAAIFGPRS